MSHPTWVRGLKHNCAMFKLILVVAPYVGAWIETFSTAQQKRIKRVAPYVGAWIETKEDGLQAASPQSHPTWVRGLKPYNKGEYRYRSLSHPTWVRGLKLEQVEKINLDENVAPYVGAWIETSFWCTWFI